MADKDDGAGEDAELDRALSDLLAETASEPVSPRLRELVAELNQALERVRRRRDAREQS